MIRGGPWPKRFGWVLGAGFVLACLIALLVSSGASVGRVSKRPAHALTSPIDPSQQTALAFGERSHWLQPWRGYLETVPATRLRGAIGINFNVAPDRARAVARLLAAAGFRRARYEIGWSNVSYRDPTRLANPGPIRAVLRALRDSGLRPLILLNANQRAPGPTRFFDIRVVAPAPAGARAVQLDPSSAKAVVPGRTGLNASDGSKAASILFTSVQGSVVTLSKPLARGLPAGRYPAATLRFEPFAPPGAPGHEETMQGWLAYVAAVTREVKAVLGSANFDVEVWNELSFGSDFLDRNTYYSPAAVGGDPAATRAAILGRTLAWLRDPANGLGGVGIADGFASQEPWPSGATAPPGLTALSKHPYPRRLRFPADARFDGIRPVDALGRPDGTLVGDAWHDTFVPRYDTYFPEYYLTAIQTEHLVRDLSPHVTDVYGTPHGRVTQADGGRPVQVWLTEMGLDPKGVARGALPRMKAKATLRTLAAWVNKGAGAVYFYAASDGPGPWGLVDPGRPDGGQTLRAVGRLTRALAGARPIDETVPISLLRVSDRHDHVQFTGDGTRAHPPLYDRDVLAFLPFQVSPQRFVVAVYVMTRDLRRAYRPELAGSDPRRYDLPPEEFELAIGGLEAARVEVAANDPLTGEDVPVRVVSRSGSRLVVELAVTDSPRLVSLTVR